MVQRAKPKRRAAWVVLAAGAWLAAAAAAAQPAAACPNCSDFLPRGGEVALTEPGSPGEGTPDNSVASVTPPGDLAAGFAWSILLLLAVPYALVGGVGAGVYLAFRKRRAAAATATQG